VLFWHIIVILVVFGAFGGILDVLQVIDVRRLVSTDDILVNSRRRLGGALLLGAFGGIGGGFAMLFILATSGKLSPENSVVNLSLLSSIFTISGFLGYRILKSVAVKVDKQIQELEERTEKKLKDTTLELQAEIGYLDAINSGLVCAGAKDTSNSAIEEATYKLNKILTVKPTDRKAAIILARIYKKQKNYSKAIEILSKAIESRKRYPELSKDTDTAALYYNRACYNNLLRAQAAKEDNVLDQELKSKMYIDLKEAINFDVSNRLEAKDDDDFDSVKTESKFLEYVTANYMISD